VAATAPVASNAGIVGVVGGGNKGAGTGAAFGPLEEEELEMVAQAIRRQGDLQTIFQYVLPIYIISLETGFE